MNIKLIELDQKLKETIQQINNTKSPYRRADLKKYANRLRSKIIKYGRTKVIRIPKRV